MKSFFVSVFILSMLLGIAPGASATDSKIGISYAQVMQHLSNSITMEKSTSVRGQSRYVGLTSDNLAMLEIIGNRNNISEATLVIGTPNNAPLIIERNTAMLMFFARNVAPEWPTVTDWESDALKAAVKTPEQTISTVRGNKRFEMIFHKSLAMLQVTVKHK